MRADRTDDTPLRSWTSGFANVWAYIRASVRANVWHDEKKEWDKN